MIGHPLTVLTQLVFGNPLVDMALSALPNPLRTELGELRRLALAGDLSFRPQELRKGDVDGERVRGVGFCIGNVRSGQVRGANLLRGTVEGGTVRGINLLQGDVEGGDVAAVNVIAGAIRGGTVKAVNLILGSMHGGEASRVNLMVGDVYDGRLDAVALIGDILGGEVNVTFHHGERRVPEEPRDGAPAEAPPRDETD